MKYLPTEALMNLNIHLRNNSRNTFTFQTWTTTCGGSTKVIPEDQYMQNCKEVLKKKINSKSTSTNSHVDTKPNALICPLHNHWEVTDADSTAPILRKEKVKVQ